MFNFKPVFLFCIALFCQPLLAGEWVAVTDESQLTSLFSGSTATATLKDGVDAKAIYNADGTGELHAWGDTFERQWRVENQQVCVLISNQWQCFEIEKHASKPDMYRATQVKSKETVVFNVKADQLIAEQPAKGKDGGAAAPSADEMAKKLANPNTPLATMNLKFQYREYEGSLANANDQSSTTVMFQPSMPFPLSNGDMVFFRPAIPLVIDQPVFSNGKGEFEGETALGDISFDLAYGRTTKTGWAFAGGMVASLPTATEDGVGTDKYSLGPEFLVAKLGKRYVLGAYPNHLWDVGGSGDTTVNVTTAQLFGTWLPGGGWSIGTSPILSYDHESEQSTIPVNLSVGKTLIFNGRPWKLGVEFNYYTEKADSFGPDWMMGFTIGPVVENALASWFK